MLALSLSAEYGSFATVASALHQYLDLEPHYKPSTNFLRQVLVRNVKSGSANYGHTSSLQAILRAFMKRAHSTEQKVQGLTEASLRCADKRDSPIIQQELRMIQHYSKKVSLNSTSRRALFLKYYRSKLSLSIKHLRNALPRRICQLKMQKLFSHLCEVLEPASCIDVPSKKTAVCLPAITTIGPSIRPTLKLSGPRVYARNILQYFVLCPPSRFLALTVLLSNLLMYVKVAWTDSSQMVVW